jgi:hypothetical protein
VNQVTNEWTLWTIIVLFIAYIVAAMIPVFFLTGLFSHMIQKVNEIRRQAIVLIGLGVAALILMPLSFTSPAVYGYLVFMPMVLWWTIAIVLPFFILRTISGHKPEWSDALTCTLYLSALFLAIALIAVLLDLPTQTVIYDPMVILQFLLPTGSPNPPGNIPWAEYQFIRVIVVMGLAFLSYGILEGVRRISGKRRNKNPIDE